jgi:putative RecB family exonuclease
VKDTNAVVPNEITRLSPSRASDFKVCPQLFKYRAIDRLPEPATVYQARGTTAHLALQRLFDLPAPQRTPEALFDLFRRAWVEVRDDEYPELFASVEEERAWGLESLELLANYFLVEDPRSFDPLDRELDMTEDLESVTMRGILDRIEEDERGDLIIVDYKTGKAPPERYALSAFFALKIYALLIRQKMGRTPVELRLLYLNGPDLYRLEVNEDQLNAMERQVKALWAAIQRAITMDNFPTRVSRLCDWCAFKDICPAWQTEDEGALVGATPAAQPI